MFDQRHDFTLTLRLLSDLHLGDGNSRDLTERIQDEMVPRSATIARDFENKPWLPGTSLKGALRAICEPDHAVAIFGAAHDAVDAVGGKLILWGGVLDEASLPEKDAIKLPDYNKAPFTYVGAHIAIDPATGSAEDGKLFFRDYVPAGARFVVRCCWQGSFEDLARIVLPVLNRAAAQTGFPLGKATRAGFGRVRIEPTDIEICSKSLALEDGNPKIAAETARLTIVPESGSTLRDLTLRCEGPFLIVDPMRAGEGGADDHVDMRTFQRDHSMPELLGTSLIGAMRGRAGWLQQVKMNLEPDDRSAKYRGKGHKLTPVQRLFGINGWAKRVRLISIELIGCESASHIYPGILLDDFTQGAVHGALYMIEAPGDLTFRIRWDVDERGLCEESYKLIEHLMADFAANGIKVGHKTGSGFGWFDVVGEIAHAA